jgi:hypothetical protein
MTSLRAYSLIIDKPISIKDEKILVDESDKVAFLNFPVLVMVIPI